MSGIEGDSVSARAVRDWCADAGIEWEEPTPGSFVIVLPGEQKFRTTVSVRTGSRVLTMNAFVIRHPDDNLAAVHTWLLERNRKTFGLSYAIDQLGDIFLVGSLPAANLTVDDIDDLMGSVLANSDQVFNHLLEMGFEEAIRAEWRWRIKTGESTGNLEAFQHLAPSAVDSELA